MLFEDLKEKYLTLVKSLDAKVDALFDKNPTLVKFDGVKVEQRGGGKLRIVLETLYKKISHTFFFTLFFGFLIFGQLISSDHMPTQAFFLGWTFWLLFITYVVVLIYVWLPVYLEFDDRNQSVLIRSGWINVFRRKPLSYLDINGWYLQKKDFKTRSGRTVKRYLFSNQLHTGKNTPLFSVVGRTWGEKVKEVIELNTGVIWKPGRGSVRKW